MKTMTLRNIPDELHKRLKIRAAQESITIEKLVVLALETYLKEARK